MAGHGRATARKAKKAHKKNRKMKSPTHRASRGLAPGQPAQKTHGGTARG